MERMALYECPHVVVLTLRPRHALQDAKIGDLFCDFPPVLQLHLKRFEYDFERDIRVKVRSRGCCTCSFPMKVLLRNSRPALSACSHIDRSMIGTSSRRRWT
jgi:hypothetical protein